MELNSFRIIQGDTGGYGAPSYKCDTNGNRLEEWSDVCEVYDKSEVDSYLYEKEEQHQHEVSLLLLRLAEKNEEIAQLQATLKVRNQQIGTLKTIRKRLEEANEKLEKRFEEIYREWKTLFEMIRGVTSPQEK